VARKIEVQIVGDASSLNRALKSSQSSLGSWAKSGAAFGVGLEVVRGGMRLLGDAIGTGINEWQESAKVAAQTAAVLKSTGGAAKVTAKDVSSLAESLMHLSGVDDEAIASGENMLLTFRNIHNEVGKGNDIFNQASLAVLDMTTAMSHGNVTQENMAKTSILVGKALNDPIKGLTALHRVGVDFTDAQEKQIKAMVKSGDVMGAQKIILKELTAEFGGSAKAMGDTLPGQINKLKESFNNLTGDLVGKAAPGLQRFLDFVNTKLIPAEGFSAKIKVVWEGLETVAQELKTNVTETLTKMFLGYDATYVVGGEQVKVHIQPTVEIDWGEGGFWHQLKENIMGGGGSQADELDAALREKLGIVGNNAVARWMSVLKVGLEGTGAVVAAAVQKGVLDPLRALQGQADAAAARVSLAIVSAIRGGLSAIGGFVGTVFNSIVTTITQRIPAAASAAAALGVRVVSGIASGLANITAVTRSRLATIGGAIAAVAGQAFGWAAHIGSQIVQGVLSGLGSLYGAVKGKIEGILGSVLGSINIPGFSPPREAAAHAIGEPLGQGVIDGWIRSSATLPEKMSSSVKAAIEKARAQIEASRERLGTAFDGMAARILRAFDAETSAIRTASEQRIDEISQRREMEDLLDRQAQAQQRLNQAIAEGGDVAAAQRDLDRATEDIALVDLKKKAEQERIELDSQNEERRLKLEQRLENEKKHWVAVGATTKTAVSRIVGIMKAFDIDFADAGALLGTAFANALQKAITGAASAAAAVDRSVPGRSTITSTPSLTLADLGSTGAAPITINNYAPISSEREFEDMVRGALANVSGRQGFG